MAAAHAPQVHDYTFEAPFALALGGSVAGLRLRYSVWGTPRADGSNVVWVCHALTGSHRVDTWWPGLVGPGKYFDPAHWCIVCANVPGSCYGSTGPLSVPPGRLSPYFHQFPRWTSRDVARALEQLARALGFGPLHTVIGGSMGGQHALEWLLVAPGRFAHAALLCSNAVSSGWGRAFDATQRRAIEADPTWPGRHPKAGTVGMQLARQVAMLSYRTFEIYGERASSVSAAEGYQQHQGRRLAQRFNAYSYWYLSHLLSHHDVGEGRGGVAAALAQVQAQTLVVGIGQDVLFPVAEQKRMARHIPGARYAELASDYGHDGFLIETDALATVLQQFYRQPHSNLHVV
ncbi:MAG: homoserine O-acetyltransferase [Bacteroidia bacterium]|nr:homoserine O-acetyltransferase [Bacteroidia bacterium]